MARPRLTTRTDLRRNVVDLAWYGDDLMDAVKQSSDAGLFAGGTVILEAARGRAPKRTGEMARSGFVLTAKNDNYVRGNADRKNIHKIMSAAREPETVMVAFSAWYSNLFEDTGRKKNIAPRSMRKRSPRGVAVATARDLRAGTFRVQSALLIPGIGYRAKVVIPKMRPRPFLADAVEGTKDQFVQAMAKVVGPAIDAALPLSG